MMHGKEFPVLSSISGKPHAPEAWDAKRAGMIAAEDPAARCALPSSHAPRIFSGTIPNNSRCHARTSGEILLFVSGGYCSLLLHLALISPFAIVAQGVESWGDIKKPLTG